MLNLIARFRAWWKLAPGERHALDEYRGNLDFWRDL